MTANMGMVRKEWYVGDLGGVGGKNINEVSDIILF